MKYKLNTILLFICMTSFSFAQQTITGIVKSMNTNELLPGVTVLLKNTNIGASTDFDGNFSIEAPLDGVLIISYVGFSTQEVAINNRNNIEISLQEDVSSLDEVVVVGYGSQKKSDITGAVSSVKVEDLEALPVARADEALQGQVAGVQVRSNDASPNSNVSIRIRGVNSINGGSGPLIIVDGVQGVNLGDVNPKDIKSMEVLKDASATAIYGSRGAGGVIIVTTTSGKIGEKPILSYNGYYTFEEVRKKMDLMNPSQYARYINENRFARNLGEVYSEEEIQSFDSGAGTDWQDEIFRNGSSMNHHINIAGGGEYAVYSISGDFLENKGIVENSEFTRFSVRPNITVNLSKKFKVGLNSFFTMSEDNPTLLNSRDAQGSPIYSSLLFSPTKPVYKEDGTYSQPGGGAGPNTEYNPLALALEPIRDNYLNKVIINPFFEWQILEGFKAFISASYQLVDGEYNYYYNEKVIDGSESDRLASVSDSKYTTFQNTNLLTYETDFGEKHNLKITGLYETQSVTDSYNYSSSRGFLTNSVTYNNLGLGQNPGIPESYRSEQSLQSFMGRINYSFNDKYLLTITGRSDAASVFAENNKSAFFPSIALGWNIHKEEFLKESEVINNLKLRTSYGEVGNAAIGPYQSLPQLVTGTSYSFNGIDLTNGVSLSTRAPNPDLKWETTAQFNVGLDMSLLSNRLSFTIDYYKKNTTDLLLSRRLYQASGFQTQLVNAGEVENKGLELLISGTPVKTDDFKWNSAITFSNNKNEVIALNSGENELSLGGAGAPGFSDAIWLEVGQPIGLIRGFEYDGVWKSDEDILAAAYGTTPGSPKYVDQNNDGMINNQDIVNISNALPDFSYSWNNNFIYKNIDLNILFLGVQGNDVYNIGRSLIENRDNGTGDNLMDAWTPTNEDTNVPGHNTLGDQRNSSRWVEDGSYFRMKNISLGYNFASKVTESIKITSIRIYATGTNLWTITNYSGYDPESNNSGGSDSYGGVDLASYPSQKKFTIGLDIKF